VRALVLRAIAWMLLAILATALIARTYKQSLSRDMAHDMVNTLVDLGLDERLVELETAPAHRRADIIAGYPGQMAQRMRLIEEDDLPSRLAEPAYVDARPVWAHPGTVYVGLGGQQVLCIDIHSSPFGTARDPAVVFVPAVMGMVVLASFAIVLPLARRLRVLTDASGRVASGDLTVRVEDDGADAIGELARQFDRMTAAIDTQRREREAFFHSVAHELGTPLSRMELLLEMLSNAKDDSARTRRVDQLHTELDELSTLTGELLSWVAQDHSKPLEPVSVDVVDIVETLCARETGHDIPIEVHASERPVVRAETAGLQRAVDNVLRNALRYASERVLVRVSGSADAVHIIVEDDGPGVPPAERTRIFEPFTRVDESRDRATGGTGLGLAIVARVMARHGGKASVTRSAELGGAAFVLSLPPTIVER